MKRPLLFYPVLSMAVAACMRSIPVLMAWPYAVGFDTTAYYLPQMLDGIPSNFLRVFKGTELNQVLLSALYSLYPHPFLILNAMAISLQAGLAVSLYFYCLKVVRLTANQSLISSFAFTANVLSFRLTWDQYRMSLGLIFVLIAWVALSSKSQRIRLLAIPFTFLIILSNFLPALLFVGSMVVYFAVRGLKTWKEMKIELVVTVIGSFLFIIQNFFLSSEGGLNVTSLMRYESIGGTSLLINGFEFFIFTCWPLAVFCPLGLRNGRMERHTIWFFLVLAIASIGPFVGLLTVYTVWIYWMVGFPLAIFTGIALKMNQSKALKYTIVASLSISLVLTTIYITSSPLSPSSYFQVDRWLTTGIPNGYLESTVPISQEGQLLLLLRESISVVMPPNSIVLLPAQFYGLALLQSNPHHIDFKDIGEIDSLVGNVSLSQVENITSLRNVYTVWFSDPTGWYGVSHLPKNFHACLTEGEFSLFQIEPMTLEAPLLAK